MNNTYAYVLFYLTFLGVSVEHDFSDALSQSGTPKLI